MACGLLQDDNEWKECLSKAVEMQTGSSLRLLFATILLWCNHTSPGGLSNQFKDKICDDLQLRLQQEQPDQTFTQEQIYDYGLYLIDRILLESGQQLKDYPSMPLSQGNWGVINNTYLLWDQLLRYDPAELARKVAENTAIFNDEQRSVYNTVMDSVRNNKGETLFVHSAGGGGGTFVCNTIAAAVRGMGKVVLCVASSGIASLLWMVAEQLIHVSKYQLTLMKHPNVGLEETMIFMLYYKEQGSLYGMRLPCNINMQ